VPRSSTEQAAIPLAGLLAVLDYVGAALTAKFSGGVPDLAFDEQNLMNVL